MPKEVTEAAEKPIKLPGTDKDVSIKAARAAMLRLTEEASELREDDTSAAKTRRTEIARQLRTIQRQIDALDPIVEVTIPHDATKQFPFRIGDREFGPGTHKVRGQIAITLRSMMYSHGVVEKHIHVAGGNVDPAQTGIASLGKDLGAI